MKIIDERGRLFGKINIIDFLVILFLFFLLPAFYLGYRIINKEHMMVRALKKRHFKVQIKCKFVKLGPGDLKFIRTGDQEVDINDQLMGEIVNLGRAEPYRYEFEVGGGQEIIQEDETLKQMGAIIQLKTEMKEDGILYYKDVAVMVGMPLNFVTNKYNLEAIVEEVPELLLTEKMVELHILLKDLDEEIIKQISAGDKEVDINGRLVAEILSLGKIEPNAFKVQLRDRSYIEREDNTKKQIHAKMRLKCQVKDVTQFYFKGKKIDIDSPLQFKTDKYIVTAMVEARSFEEKWITLEVKFTGVTPEIANVVQKDDEEKNPREKVIARIFSIIENKPSEMLALQENRFISVNHPFHKNILASIEVLCVEKKGVYYFKDYPVKIGNNITFTPNLYSITGLIVGIEIK